MPWLRRGDNRGGPWLDHDVDAAGAAVPGGHGRSACRHHDPLWLLARQWQVASSREDSGSPAVAWWGGRAPRPVLPGPLPTGDQAGEPFDSSTIPLETLVERGQPGPARQAWARSRLTPGAHSACSASGRPAPTATSSSTGSVHPLTDAEAGRLDEASLGFVDLVMPRLPDGANLRGRRRSPAGLDAAVAPGDVAEVQSAAEPGCGGHLDRSRPALPRVVSRCRMRLLGGGARPPGRRLTAREYYRPPRLAGVRAPGASLGKPPTPRRFVVADDRPLSATACRPRFGVRRRAGRLRRGQCRPRGPGMLLVEFAVITGMTSS